MTTIRFDSIGRIRLVQELLSRRRAGAEAQAGALWLIGKATVRERARVLRESVRRGVA